MTFDLFSGKKSGVPLDKINERIRACEKCPHRSEVIRTLPGWGAMENPKILLLGQHPGRGEDVLGKILAKQAGEYIRDQFYRLGLTDMDIYWDNIVHCCLPVNAEEIPKHQLDNCAPFMEETIDSLNPKLIVGLGNMVRDRLFAPKYMEAQKKKASSLLESRFKVWDYRGYPFVVMVSPAALLRKKGFERETFQFDTDKDFEFLRRLLQDRGLM